MITVKAAPYEKGQTLEPFQANDQYDNTFTLKPSETHFLLVSHDMETGKKANAALTARGKDYLGTQKAVYVANIFGMPGIGRLFAIPKMKKYNHRIILADDAALIAHFPQQQGKVTVLSIVGGKIEAIAYWTPGTESIDGYLK
ncbi:MAG: FAD/FMN-containing dehydrogenase [Verrucomicrobiota bacterium]